jgi:uncharacterized damage-inducible protein DinB
VKLTPNFGGDMAVDAPKRHLHAGRYWVENASMKPLLLAMLLAVAALHGQPAQEDPLAGQWQGYDGEWGHVSRQLVSLAVAIPVEKFAWRPAQGVRSTSEVFMHIAITNFFLLSITGPRMPADLKSADMEKTVTSKADVLDWLKRSLDAVKNAHASVKPVDLQRKVKVDNRDATVDGMYLRIIVHANEHMGQLVAYARMNGITPPWSESAAK